MPKVLVRGASVRVAVYLHTLFNGGIERVMFDLAAEMMRRGIAVDVVVNTLEYSPMIEQLPKGASLVNLECRGFLDRLPRLMRYLRTARPDAMLSAGHFSNEIAILARIFSHSKTRCVVTEHTNLGVELKTLGRMCPRRFAVPFLCTLLYRFADAMVAVSDGVRMDCERLFHLPPNRCITIRNPLDATGIRTRSMESLEHSWLSAGGPPVVLAIGRLELQKDFQMLLDAFALLRQRIDARLIVLGEGSQRASLLARVKQLKLEPWVEFPGFVANPYPYLRLAKVFCVSSRWEGLSVSLLEALALGTPAVSTDCPSGPREVLCDGRWGILTPVGDSRAFAEGLLRAIEAGAPEMSEDALQSYRVDSVTDRYLSLLLPGWNGHPVEAFPQ
uniref:Putative glycosyl transferase family 1 n=1 Tax=mine drainage metagenome TaxID=410659 RepID=E6QMH0_9ZZZZ